jgi:hypothetical protein
MTNALKQIVNYEKLKILAPFESVCFRHALFKACQYAISDEKVNLGLQHVSINSYNLQLKLVKKIKKKKSRMEKGYFGYRFATT